MSSSDRVQHKVSAQHDSLSISQNGAALHLLHNDEELQYIASWTAEAITCAFIEANAPTDYGKVNVYNTLIAMKSSHQRQPAIYIGLLNSKRMHI